MGPVGDFLENGQFNDPSINYSVPFMMTSSIHPTPNPNKNHDPKIGMMTLDFAFEFDAWKKVP